MTRLSSVRCFVTGLAVLALVYLTSAVAAFDLRQRESPRAAFDHLIAAFNALDWKSFRASFADDATVFNPDIPEVESLHRVDGRAEIEHTFHAVFGSRHSPNIAPENIRIQQFDDTAIITFEFKRPGDSFGRRTVVLHYEGSRWLIVHIHASNATRAPNPRLERP